MTLKTAFAYGFSSALDPENTFDATQSFEDSDAKKAQDAIDAALTRLENPTVGMTVTLATGEVWTFDDTSEQPGWYLSNFGDEGDGMTKPHSQRGLYLWVLCGTNLFKAAIQSGLCSVVPGEGEN